MLFCLILGVAVLLPGIFFAVLAIQSTNASNLITTYGELTKKKNYKNYRLRHGFAPNAAQYTYKYKAKGKNYYLRGVQLTHSRKLRKSVTVVYLRSFPRCAYIDRFSGIAEWLIAISFVALGMLMVLLYFFVS